jgi:hypothetical protein
MVVKTCISFIENIDTYIRNIDVENIDMYDDFYPFVDKDDILLYKDIDKETIMSYTFGILFESKISSNKKENIFYAYIASYILAIKLLSDCSLFRAYSFSLDMLREFDDLSKISKKLLNDYNDDKIIEKIKKVEWYILKQNNFFTNKIEI